MKVIELFAGVGAWSKALENLKIEHEVVAAIEFDEKTIKCYNIIHGSNFTRQDITKVSADDLPSCDMVCYSPPCQSFSQAGRNRGIDDARGTLFYDALRIILAKQPKYCLMENVKNLTGKKHRETFNDMLKCLEDIGYTNYWKVINSKDMGVPHNRERVYIISIRNDIDQTFVFPDGCGKEVKLKHIIEDENVVEARGCSLRTRSYRGQAQQLEVRKDELSNAITRVNKDAMVALTLADVLEEDAVLPILHNIYGGFGEKKPREFHEYSPTIRTSSGGGHIPSVYSRTTQSIRNLSPLECFRLQAFSDVEHRKLKEAKISNTQLYRLMGNTITVSVAEALFLALLCPSEKL